MVVTYAGIPIWAQQDDLCAKTACPVAVGPVEVAYLQEFPIFTPPVGSGLPAAGSTAAFHCYQREGVRSARRGTAFSGQ